ncbi:hypothetical protein A2U01_0085729, partial [Trifolium medium]|nr:hypothetical protein [Trifolium medium]
AQRTCKSNNPKVSGWSEEASGWTLAQRASPRPASSLLPGFSKAP